MSKNQKSRRTADDKASSGSISSVFQMFAVSVGLLLAYHLFLAQPNVAVAQHSGVSKGIVVVDSKAVFGAYMEIMQGRIAGGEEFTEGGLNLSGQEFAVEYMRAIKKYRDAGYLVIDKANALGVPNNSEITKEIGTALNLNVVPTPDPFSAPALN